MTPTHQLHTNRRCACENCSTATFMMTGRLAPKTRVMIISHPAPTWTHEAYATSCRAQASKVPLEEKAASGLTSRLLQVRPLIRLFLALDLCQTVKQFLPRVWRKLRMHER
jgi:hypothetical protein